MLQETEFACKLEIFRREEEEAQQHFFCWLAIRDLAARNANVLGVMNATPSFWLITERALLHAAFVSLGRVFDQKSEHNLDRLMNVAGGDLSIFSKAALLERKEAANISKQQAAAFVRNTHQLTRADIKILKGQIGAKRGIYAGYREIRNRVFAHNGVADRAQVNKLFAKTNINEMKDIFGFLHALHVALDQLFLNGRKPDVRPYAFRLPPHQPRPGQMAPGERVYREAQTVLSLLPAPERINAADLKRNSLPAQAGAGAEPVRRPSRESRSGRHQEDAGHSAKPAGARRRRDRQGHHPHRANRPERLA
jgi:hypothetical protein